MSATPETVEAIADALRHHRRALSPTGQGVQCDCGQHYRDTHAWGRHLAELAAAAIAADALRP